MTIARTNIDDFLRVLDKIPIPMLILHRFTQDSYLNGEACKLLGVEELEKLPQFKKEITSVLDTLDVDDLGPPKKLKLPLQDKNGRSKKVQLLVKRLTGDYLLIILRDITKELSFIEDYVLLKMEKEARNILQKKKEEELSVQKTMLKRLLESLPDGVSFVSPTRKIGLNNLYAQRIFPNDNPEYCYELFDRKEPCPTCRLDNALAVGSPMVTGHRISGQSLTENIIPFKDGKGALLVFRDTSRPVELINKLKEQRDTIRRQKELFEGLANMMNYMQEEDNPDEVLHIFLALLSRHIPSKGILLLVDGLRRGEIMLEESRSLTERQQEGLKRAYLGLSLREKGISLIPDRELKELFSPEEEIHQYPILRAKDSQIGLLVIVTRRREPPKKKLLSLFLESLTGYIKNLILTKKLEERANKDELTGLYNRHYFEVALGHEQEKAKKYAIPFSVIVADVNGLKYINDKFGHELGDKLIKEIASIFVACARGTDLVARLGGDEFAVLLPNTPQENAVKLLKRIKAACSERSITLPDGNEYPVSVSLGVAGSDQYGPNVTMKMADKAMYKDKERYYSTRRRYR